MGFTFLESNKLLVDYTNRVLVAKCQTPMQCLPMAGEKMGVIQRESIQGQLPRLQEKKHSADVGYDFFAPYEI